MNATLSLLDQAADEEYKTWSVNDAYTK